MNTFKIKVNSTHSVGVSVFETNDEEAIIGLAVEILLFWLSLKHLAREYIENLF